MSKHGGGKGPKGLAQKIADYAIVPLPEAYPPRPPETETCADLVPVTVPPADSPLRRHVGVDAVDEFKAEPSGPYRSFAPAGSPLTAKFITPRDYPCKE